MKKMQVILLVALSSALLLFGCGKKQKEQNAKGFCSYINGFDSRIIIFLRQDSGR